MEDRPGYLVQSPIFFLCINTVVNHGSYFQHCSKAEGGGGGQTHVQTFSLTMFIIPKDSSKKKLFCLREILGPLNIPWGRGE